MRSKDICRLLLGLFACLTFVSATARADDGATLQSVSAHIKARLVTQSPTVPQGGDIYAAIDYTPTPGWHTYWVNPGDTGLATRIAWSLPDGMSAGDISFPTPKLLPAQGLTSYGFEGRTVLLIKLHNASPLKPGETLPLKARVDFLVCADICVPESLDVATLIKVGPAKSGSGTGTVEKALRALPGPAPISATIALKDGIVALGFQAAGPGGSDVLAHPQGAYFFPTQEDALSPPAPQVLDIGANGFSLRAKADGKALPDGVLSGVLKLGDGTAYAVTLARGDLAPGVHGLGAAPAQETDTSLMGVVVAMGLAFVGGLILNLMPCVFPVLSMKLLGLSRAGHDAFEGRSSGARREALVYGAGVILSFVTLAGLLQVAHSLGASLGWGFQLQSPYVVAILSLVMLLVALNMSGVFEIGQSLQGIGAGAFDQKRPLLGAFLTGVLAVVVAAPCTAPFMATAIGVALAQGGVTSFAIFIALGLGFAAPFVALTYLIALVPGVASALPRPGKWMDYLKIALSLLMYAAAAWLVWVFAQQVESGGVALLVIALIAVAISVQRLALPKLVKAGFLIAGIALSIAASTLPRTSKIESMPSGLIPHRDFHIATLADLRAHDTPVLVDLTAAWCVTCKVNERLVLSTPAFEKALKDTGTVYMVGDWTNQDAEISHYLSLYGRSGVPLYVYYGAHNAAPVVLPQILNTDAVVKTLRGGAAKP